jgi:hypothetical protein
VNDGNEGVAPKKAGEIAHPFTEVPGSGRQEEVDLITREAIEEATSQAAIVKGRSFISS